VLAAGYRVIAIEETTSTNDECLAAARAGDPGNLWIRAVRQSAARGSRGRNWQADEGNLFASLLLIDPAAPTQLANLTFVAALAVHDALTELSAMHGRNADIALKWPNDVLLSGAKVSGILLESHQFAGRNAVIIGIGVNCLSHPDGTLHRATDLAAQGMPVPAADLHDLIAGAMAARIAQWDAGAGFAAIRADWLARARGPGQAVTVRLPGREMAGIFEELSAEGYLVLGLADGRRVTVPAADVFFAQREGSRDG